MRLQLVTVCAALLLPLQLTAQGRSGTSPLRPLNFDESAYADIGRLSRAAEAPSGEFVLVDQTTARIHVFLNSGRLKCTAGARGSGPGEFQVVSGLWVTANRMTAFDGATHRLTRFDLNCRLLDSRATPSLQGSPSQVLAVSPEGSLLLSQIDRSVPTGDGLISRSLVLAVASADGPVRIVGSIPGNFVYNVAHGQATTAYDVPFLGRALFGGADSGFALVERDSRSIQLRATDWSLKANVDLALPAAPFDRRVVLRHRDSLLTAVASSGRGRFPGAAERIEYAFGDRFPQVANLAAVTDVMALGPFVFVRPYASPGSAQEWLVLRVPERRIVGVVRVPAGVRIVGPAYSGLIGVQHDENDEEIPVLLAIVPR